MEGSLLSVNAFMWMVRVLTMPRQRAVTTATFENHLHQQTETIVVVESLSTIAWSKGADKRQLSFIAYAVGTLVRLDSDLFLINLLERWRCSCTVNTFQKLLAQC